MHEVGLVRGRQSDVQAALFESEVGELLARGLAELGNDFPAFGGKRLAGPPEFGLKRLEFGIEAAQLGITLLQAFELAACFVAEGNDLRHSGAVFALQRVDEVKPLLKLLQPAGINV